MIDIIENAICYVIENKEWLLSGVGLLAFSLLLKFYGFLPDVLRQDAGDQNKNDKIQGSGAQKLRKFRFSKILKILSNAFGYLKNRIIYYYHRINGTSYLVEPVERKKYARMMVDGDVFFADRFSSAFPGCRMELEIDEPNEACRRLDVLLQSPISLNIRRKAGEMHLCPIWWFRGGENLHIEKYTRLRRFGIWPTRDIMFDGMVLHRIRKIVAIGSHRYWANMVYVETDGVEPSGLYNEYVNNYSIKRGFAREEVGIFRGKFIPREHYDDGATLVRGRPVSTAGKARLQIRYLTPYNFILAPNESPINDSNIDDKIEELLNDILLKNKNIDDLVEFVSKLRRNRPIIHRSMWEDFSEN